MFAYIVLLVIIVKTEQSFSESDNVLVKFYPVVVLFI